MPNIILSINAGSSSVKVSIFSYSTNSSEDPKELAVIQISGLTAPPAKLKYTRGHETIQNKELLSVKTAEQAYEYILNDLINDSGLPELGSPNDIEFACHRIVHGGDFDRPTRIDKD